MNRKTKNDMAGKRIGKKITESAEEVDVLLDDMAVLSQQMKEGKRLYSEEELQQKVQDEVQDAIEDAGIDTPVVIPGGYHRRLDQRRRRTGAASRRAELIADRPKCRDAATKEKRNEQSSFLVN